MGEKNKLSIALVSSYAFASEPGGVNDFILGLKEALQRNGCKVVVIAPGPKDLLTDDQVDYILGSSVKITTDQTVFRASLSRKGTAKKILEIVKPDIIVIHEPFVPSIGHTIISSVIRIKDRALRPIVVGQFHARREAFNWQFKAVEFVARHLVRRPKLDGRSLLGLSSGFVTTINSHLDGRIAISNATKDFWRKKLPSDYEVIYNGIDTNKLSVNGPKIEDWMKDGKRTILFAGRHDPRKGIDDLINAFKLLVSDRHDDLKLKITGEGETTAALQKLVAKLGLQKLVEFVGFLPYEKLIEAYRAADLVVAPSRDGEGFNRTIIEARSCGALVVCTDIKGQDEAIGQDLFPFMAKPKNPSSLSKQIMEVLNLSEAKKQEIRKQSRKDVESSFSWDKIAKEHLEYYRSLLEN